MDPSLMRGEGWVRCCICGELHWDPYPGLYRDPGGVLVDVCIECAEEAGYAS
jgi:hypothetical protein